MAKVSYMRQIVGVTLFVPPLSKLLLHLKPNTQLIKLPLRHLMPQNAHIAPRIAAASGILCFPEFS
jgi:hypothetical protein